MMVPKTLTAAISPMLIINWILGIGVVEYPTGRPRRIISLFLSAVNFFIYLTLLKVANFGQIKEFYGSRIAGFIFTVMNYIYVLFIASSICLARIQAKVVGDIRHRLNVINDRLKTLEIPNDYELIFKTLIIQMSLVLALNFFRTVLDYKYYVHNVLGHTSRTGILMLFTYLCLFTSVVDDNFTTSIKYLGNRFRRLNILLTESDSAEKRKTTFARESDDLLFRYYSSVISEIHGNNLLAIRAAQKQWLLYVIIETRKIHRSICKMAAELNRAFGIQLLHSVAISCSTLIVLAYEFYIVTLSSNSLLHGNLMNNIPSLTWIAFYAIRIILIIDTCDTTSHEANRTKEVINKLLDTAACDEDIRNEIDNFSLQLLQNPLNFTACGFFNLDYSLVHGIIGSVTTYLVIMIQMRGIYEPESVNSTPNSTMLVYTNGMD